jgi:hypothetical protein
MFCFSWILWTVHLSLRSQVLTAASVKTTVFWVVTPCSLVDVYRRFTGACCLHHQCNDSSHVVNLYGEDTLCYVRRLEALRIKKAKRLCPLFFLLGCRDQGTVPLTHRPDDGGSEYLWNVGKLLPDYTAQQPRRHLQYTYCCSDLLSYCVMKS